MAADIIYLKPKNPSLYERRLSEAFDLLQLDANHATAFLRALETTVLLLPAVAAPFMLSSLVWVQDKPLSDRLGFTRVGIDCCESLMRSGKIAEATRLVHYMTEHAPQPLQTTAAKLARTLPQPLRPQVAFIRPARAGNGWRNRS